MRMMKKGGAPRDRRIDRRKVAMAAAAVLLLFATKVQAQPTATAIDFQIDETQSYFSIQGGGFQPGDSMGRYNTASFLAGTAQNPALINGGTVPMGSLNSPLRGHLFADVNFSSNQIQFYATGMNQMEPKTTGNYFPGETGGGAVVPPVGPGPQPGNFGAKVAAIAAFQREYGITLDSPVSLDPTLSGPVALTITGGNSFDATGIVMPQTNGVEDITTGLPGVGPYKISLVANVPVNYSDTYDPNTGAHNPPGYNSDTGTIDPTTFQLIIPINFVLYNEVTVGGNRDYQVVTLRGQIVANPFVPEPSTITLFAFGIVGLLSYAWRARKRKALVA